MKEVVRQPEPAAPGWFAAVRDVVETRTWPTI